VLEDFVLVDFDDDEPESPEDEPESPEDEEPESPEDEEPESPDDDEPESPDDEPDSPDVFVSLDLPSPEPDSLFEPSSAAFSR